MINNQLIPPSPGLKTENLRPFTRFCLTIGMIPSSYKESMTYEEQLLWFCNYLENTVIPAINNNGEVVKELQDLFVELKNYVNNYFTNLDVQEEINNKLDKMAEDGTLQEIISDYLNSKALFVFNNIQQMKEATNLINGSYAQTLGYYSINDGGKATYLIREKIETDIEDLGAIHFINDNLVAELIIENQVNVKQFGAKGDNETDDTQYFINMFAIYNKCKSFYIPNGNYLLNQGLIIPDTNINISGEDMYATVLKFNITEGYAINGAGTATNNKRFNINNLSIRNNNQEENQANGILLDYNTNYELLTNVRIHSFYDNIKIETNWDIILRNVYSQNAKHRNLTTGTSICNSVSLIGGYYLDSDDINIQLEGRNHIIQNVDFSSGKNRCLYALRCYALHILGCYLETNSDATDSSIFIKNSFATHIDTLDISANSIVENYKHIKVENSYNTTITNIHIMGAISRIVPYGIHLKDSTNNIISNCYLDTCNIGIYVENSTVEINLCTCGTNTTTFIKQLNEYARIIISMLGSYLEKCLFEDIRTVKITLINVKHIGYTADLPRAYFRGQQFFNLTNGKLMIVLTPASESSEGVWVYSDGSQYQA